MKYLFFSFFLFCFSCKPGNNSKLEANKKKSREKKAEVFIKTLQKKSLFEPIVFGGTIEPTEQRGFFTLSSGVVSQIYVKLGEKVKKNQKIMQITPKDKMNYKSFYLLSPMDGYFLSIRTRTGDYLTENQRAGTIAKLDKFQTTIQANLRDLNYLTLGRTLEITLAEHTKLEQKISGIVKEVSPIADTATGTFKVTVTITCPVTHVCYKSLKAGTYLRAVLKKNLREGIKIPLSYLTDENKKVFVLKKNNIVSKVKVSLGKNYGDSVEVLKGLKPGDQVIVSYSKTIKEGDKVVVLDNKL